MPLVQLKTVDGTIVELDPAEVIEIRQIDGRAQIEQVTEKSSVPRRIVLAETPARVLKLLSAAG